MINECGTGYALAMSMSSIVPHSSRRISITRIEFNITGAIPLVKQLPRLAIRTEKRRQQAPVGEFPEQPRR